MSKSKKGSCVCYNINKKYLKRKYKSYIGGVLSKRGKRRFTSMELGCAYKERRKIHAIYRKKGKHKKEYWLGSIQTSISIQKRNRRFVFV